MNCFFCKKPVPILDNKIGFREDCPHCGRELHICKNCNFYDTSVYNECKESNAERVVDKEKANYCDYFAPSMAVGSGNGTPLDPAAEAKRKLEAMFKK